MSAINSKDAHDLLVSHLVAQLSDPPRGYERYKRLYDLRATPRRQGRGLTTIRDLLFTSMRTEIFEIFSTPFSKPKAETIRSKAGDISKPQRGVYLHIIEGTDNRWRFYVGQSDNLSFRIRRQHRNFRYRRDNPSFHNFAMQKGRWDHFIILAVLQADPTSAGFNKQEQGLLLNILEMWRALLFCTLQPSTMAQWHEHGADAGAGRPWCGLNLGCPLDQGGPPKFVNWRHPLSESEDTLANAYVIEVLDARRELTPGRGLIYGLMIAAAVAVFMASISGGQGGVRVPGASRVNRVHSR